MIGKPELTKKVCRNSVKTNQLLKAKFQNLSQTHYNGLMENNWGDYHPSIDELISLRQASEISGLTTNHLRLLIARGNLWAKKVDSFWVTTEKSILEYLQNRSKPGRKKKSP